MRAADLFRDCEARDALTARLERLKDAADDVIEWIDQFSITSSLDEDGPPRPPKPPKLPKLAPLPKPLAPKAAPSMPGTTRPIGPTPNTRKPSSGSRHQNGNDAAYQNGSNGGYQSDN